jgi:hypothetical protein
MLGNGSSTTVSRSKSKALVVKRIKEIKTAKDYTAFQGSAGQGSAACGLSNGSVNVTYYHDALENIPMRAGTKVYTRQRANSRYYAADGHYKIGPDKGRYFNMEIRAGVLRANATPC